MWISSVLNTRMASWKSQLPSPLRHCHVALKSRLRRSPSRSPHERASTAGRSELSPLNSERAAPTHLSLVLISTVLPKLFKLDWISHFYSKNQRLLLSLNGWSDTVSEA